MNPLEDPDDEDNPTLLIAACIGGRLDIIEYLVLNEANVNVRCAYDGFTPLTRASERGHLDLVKLLLSSGAKINDVDKEGYTAIYQSVAGDIYKLSNFFLRMAQTRTFKITPRDIPVLITSS